MSHSVELDTPAAPPTGPAAGSAGGEAAPVTVAERRAGRRRGLLLGAALAVPAAVVLAGFPSAWPLLVIPLVMAGPLCGPRGLVAGGAVSAAVIALASGTEGAPADDMALGLVAFMVAALAVAAGSRLQARRLEDAAGQSITDRLTGLRNYAYLEDVLARECRRAERYGTPFSLVLLDLDRFKQFNDRHGHDAGNRLLAGVGRAISEEVRASDVAARFGGEEFALVISGPEADAATAAHRVRAAIGAVRVRVPGGGEAGATASAGLAEWAPDEDVRALVVRADDALYASKRGGRDRLTAAEDPASTRERQAA